MFIYTKLNNFKNYISMLILAFQSLGKRGDIPLASIIIKILTFGNHVKFIWISYY